MHDFQAFQVKTYMLLHFYALSYSFYTYFSLYINRRAKVRLWIWIWIKHFCNLISFSYSFIVFNNESLWKVRFTFIPKCFWSMWNIQITNRSLFPCIIWLNWQIYNLQWLKIFDKCWILLFCYLVQTFSGGPYDPSDMWFLVFPKTH